MTTETLIAGADTSEAGGQPNAEGDKPGGTGAEPAQVDTKTPEGDTAKTGDDKAAGDKKDEAAEVVYEFEMPEGVELDTASADEFKTIAKDLKLSKEDAQKVVNLAVKREQARIEAHHRTVNEWAESVRNDKEIGGDKLAANLAIAKKAIDLGPPELKELLNETGMGNHPAVVKWALAIGKSMSEDRLIPANKPGGANPTGAKTDEDRADRLYGKP